MLRDIEMSWPWYARQREAIRNVAPRVDRDSMHQRALAVLKQLDHYGDATRAGFAAAVPDHLDRVAAPALLFGNDNDIRYAAVSSVGKGLRNAELVTRPDTAAERARTIAQLLD